jgi:hypothetical protein
LVLDIISGFDIVILQLVSWVLFAYLMYKYHYYMTWYAYHNKVYYLLKIYRYILIANLVLYLILALSLFTPFADLNIIKLLLCINILLSFVLVCFGLVISYRINENIYFIEYNKVNHNKVYYFLKIYRYILIANLIFYLILVGVIFTPFADLNIIKLLLYTNILLSFVLVCFGLVILYRINENIK